MPSRFLLASLLVSGCSCGVAVPLAGVDAGHPDSGRTDAGHADAGPSDAGPADAPPVVEADASDAAITDAGACGAGVTELLLEPARADVLWLVDRSASLVPRSDRLAGAGDAMRTTIAGWPEAQHAMATFRSPT